MEKRSAVLLVCVLLQVCTRMDGRAFQSQSVGEGEVYVYLQPLPLETERIAFSIDTVSVTSDSGAEASLKLSLKSVTEREVRRQRLLAAGRVAAGSYTGLAIKVQKASLRRETGEAALLVPDSAFKVASPFVVARGSAVVLWVSVASLGGLPGDVTFSPVFSVKVADRPIPGRAGFVSNSRSNSITMFDKRLRQAAVVIPTAGGPIGMALDQRRGRLYVACSRDDEIQAIDVAAVEIVEQTRLAPGDGPREIALTPDGATLVSANASSNTVGVFDTDPLTRLDRIGVGSGPGSLVIDPTGRRAFVFNTQSSSVSVIDIASRTLVATIATESAPLRGQFSTRGDRLYVIHEKSPYMTVLDPLQLSIVARARLKSGLGAIRVDTRRNLIYIGGPNDTLVEFYDPNTLLPVDTVNAGTGISHMTIDGEENNLYLAGSDRPRLVICSLADRRIVSEIDVTEGLGWVAVMGER